MIAPLRAAITPRPQTARLPSPMRDTLAARMAHTSPNRTPIFLTPNRAEPLLAALEEAPVLGIDTEFMRESSYFAELCLVQLATPQQIFLVDPLADANLEPLWRTLLGRAWIVHSGRQDLEVVYQASGALPDDIFDTQIAAALLGYAPQLGYANLVRELFDVELSKSQTRADWRRRPLSDAMLSYAAADVDFLLEAKDLLEERLDKEGRRDWAREDSRTLLERGLYNVDPETAIDRLKGARRLTGPARARARALAAWRERRAVHSDRPRQWIMKDAPLIEIARSAPDSVDALADIDGLPAGLLRRSGADLVDLVQNVPNHDDGYRPPGPPTEREKKLLKAMQEQVAAISQELDIAAEVLAPKRTLTAAMRGERSTNLFTGWRGAVVGERLATLLA